MIFGREHLKDGDRLPRPVAVAGWTISAGAIAYTLAHAVVAWIS